MQRFFILSCPEGRGGAFLLPEERRSKLFEGRDAVEPFLQGMAGMHIVPGCR